MRHLVENLAGWNICKYKGGLSQSHALAKDFTDRSGAVSVQRHISSELNKLLPGR